MSQTETSVNLQEAGQKWSPGKKAGALFLMFYLFIYIFPSPLNIIPGLRILSDWYAQFWEATVYFVGMEVLRMAPFEHIPSGSGDSTFDYASLATVAVLSVFFTLLLLAVTWRRPNYELWWGCILTYTRYTLAIYLLIYGIGKLPGGQFGYLGFSELEQPYGAGSPMGMVWNFMGYSPAYTLFTGIAETLAGFLLFFRKTTVLGCMLAIAVMANIVMINFCYDVPVKLFSSQLLLFAIILIWPNMAQLYRILIKGQATALKPYRPLILQKKRWMRISRIAVKSFFVVVFPLMQVFDYIRYQTPELPEQAIYGSYRVREFRYNNRVLPAITSDTLRWQKLILEDGGAIVFTMNDSVKYYEAAISLPKNQLLLSSYDDPNEKYTLQFKEEGARKLTLWGNYSSGKIAAVMDRKKREDYLLINRGFHWINEFPYNR